MAVSGIVLTLSDDDAKAANALESLARDVRITLGERFGKRVAAVAETPSVDGDRELWDDLHRTPGIEFVDVTFVALDETASQTETSHVDS